MPIRPVILNGLPTFQFISPRVFLGTSFFFFFLILFLCYKTCLFDVLKKFERGEKRQVTYIQESDKASIIGEGLLIEWEMRNEGMEDVVILFELCILFLPKW